MKPVRYGAHRAELVVSNPLVPPGEASEKIARKDVAFSRAADLIFAEHEQKSIAFELVHQRSLDLARGVGLFDDFIRSGRSLAPAPIIPFTCPLVSLRALRVLFRPIGVEQLERTRGWPSASTASGEPAG